MKKNLKLQLLAAVTMAMLTACTDAWDNPAVPEPVNPETPEQQAFWARFDAWQTDSCTLGDDFYMHMIGTWWKNPVDIYPGGLMQYAKILNNERVNAIRSSEPNLAKIKSHINDKLTMSDDEVEQMANAKVDELWDGATTRDEALAALGRAWAQGYTLILEPRVNLVNGVPTWQLDIKFPLYVNIYQLSKESPWQATDPRQNARMKTRAEQQAASDVDKIIKGMNIGIDHIEIKDRAQVFLQYLLDYGLNSLEDIKYQIKEAVILLDGTLVNDKFVAEYNEYLADMLPLHDYSGQVVLRRQDILNNVLIYMGSLYSLNYYNRQYITPAMRQQYTKWCEQFRDAMRQRLETNTWMEEETRQNALDKLEKMLFYVGDISDIPDCAIPTLTGQTIIDDVRQLRKAQLDVYCWAATKTCEEATMLLSPYLYAFNYTADEAWNIVEGNYVMINPSNLLSPYIEDDYDDALQWAFLATTIGHEMIHGFDITGSQYDMWGNKTNWWTEADAAKFKALCSQLTDRYNQLQLIPWIDPTLYCNGQKTLGENIADLGGCCLGLQILLNEHPNATDKEVAALTRRYFQGWAIQWGSYYNVEQAKQTISWDAHSLSRERTNGVVRNMDEWYDAYGIKSGSLYLPPSQRVHIW